MKAGIYTVVGSNEELITVSGSQDGVLYNISKQMMSNMQEVKKPKITAEALGVNLFASIEKRLKGPSSLKEPGKDIKDIEETAETPVLSSSVLPKEETLKPDNLTMQLQALGATMQDASQTKMRGG